MVRAVVGQEVLHEAVQSVRLDPRGSVDRGHPKLLDHSEHFRRTDLVYCTGFDDRVQRRDGVHVWVLLRADTAH